MRIALFLGFLMTAVWIAYVVRLHSVEDQIIVCAKECERKFGRAVSSISPGFIIKCHCGERKKLKSMDQP